MMVKQNAAAETRAHSSNIGKRPLVATALSNKMLHTMSTGMHATAVDFAGEPLGIQMNPSNVFEFGNKTQLMNNVQSGHQNISNEDLMHQSFTVFEEVDHSKKSMIQFLTKVGSIQNLQHTRME